MAPEGTPTFTAGDRVRCVRAVPVTELIYDALYTVVEYCSESGCVNLQELPGDWFVAERFKLLVESAPVEIPPTATPFVALATDADEPLSASMMVSSDIAKATEGVKFDAGKAPLSLIPRDALVAEGDVLAFGARKYSAHNWRKGMDWSRLGDAAMRHLTAWLDGENVDPETGLSHLAHLRACAGFLITYEAKGLGRDDRHTAAA